MICNGEKINQIRFNHKGLDVAFRCFLEDNDISLDRTMVINFEDMEEVTTLIRLLEDFKAQAKYRYLGAWKGCILPDD